ncbi:MAG TPA: DUF2141 domain-containing protein [Sphingomonadaceae bacterium]|nr:DUF2141 domain-containing protein [Sphingomonadaceae bacterium]
MASIVPALSLLSLFASTAVSAADLDVAVSGVRNDKGVVHVDVCTPETFLKDCAWHGEAPARQGTTIVTIRNLPPGHYAAQGFHDENRNGKADQGFLGIPKEGVGFSNDAPIRLAPPRLKDALFDYTGAATPRITFKLRYF